MPGAIVYCDQCSRMILHNELDRGKALVTPNASLCPECADLLSPEERAALVDAPAEPSRAGAQPRAARGSARRSGRPGSTRTSRRELQASAATGTPRRHSRGMQAAPRGKSSSTTAIAILIGAVIVGVGVAVMSTGGGSGSPRRRRRPRTTTPVTSVPRPADTAPADRAASSGQHRRPDRAKTPGAQRRKSKQPGWELPQQKSAATAPERLEEIRAMIDERLDRYEDIAISLKAFPGEFPEAKEVAQAKELLAEVEADLAKLADVELESSRETAAGLAAEGKYDEAASVLRLVRGRYAGSEWFGARGESEIAAALTTIEKARAESLGPAVTEAAGPAPGDVEADGAPDAGPADEAQAAAAEAAGAAGEVQADGDVQPDERAAEDVAPKWPEEPLPGETGLPGQWAPGLIAEIFNGNGYTERIGVRIERAIDFILYEAPPDLDAPKDNFTIRWTGWLLIPFDGEYAFEAQASDSISVSLGGEPLVSGNRQKGRSAVRQYTAGLYPISATYYNGTPYSNAQLYWQEPGRGTVAIPPEYFYHRVPELGAMGPPAKLCRGLRAEYYAGEDFQRKMAEGTCEHVDFNAGDLPICSAVRKDHFSVRMKGYLLVPKAGTYRFEINVDDGARLIIDGTPVMERWSGRSNVLLMGEVELAAGFRKFVLEYMDKSSDAFLTMNWRLPPGLTHAEEIPSTLFFHEPPAPVTSERDGLAPGLKGRMFRTEVPGRGKPLVETYAPSAFFSWDKVAPAPGVPVNGFSAAWQGHLVVPTPGQYLFRVRHYGGVRLAIARRPLITKWSPKEGWQKGRIALRAGEVPFMLTYFNRKDRAGVEVYWAGPNFGFRRLGAEALAHKAGELPMGKVVDKPAPVAVAGGAPTGGAGRKAIADKPETRAAAPKAGAAATDAAGTKPAAPKLPAGNLVKNGGFEQIDKQSRFAKLWKPHQWGKKGVQFSVRTDRMETHTGDRSLLARGFGDGAKFGAFTSLVLPAATYEVSYWACADGEETAQVGVHFAGRDLETRTVGDEWQQFRETVEVPKKQLGASVGIWTSTVRVRVWFDDVEIRAVR